jgi:hypothetical protein
MQCYKSNWKYGKFWNNLHGILHSEVIKCEHHHLQIHFIFSTVRMLGIWSQMAIFKSKSNKICTISFALNSLSLLHQETTLFTENVIQTHNHIIYIPHNCWYTVLSITLFLTLFLTLQTEFTKSVMGQPWIQYCIHKMCITKTKNWASRSINN